jgi:alcohol dehydrogenase
VVDRHSVVPIDDDVPPEVAAVLGCAVLTGGGAVINAGKPADGETVMIVRLGGVGMGALLTALSLGKGDVIGVDAVPAKLSAAAKLGATATYTPQQVADLHITGRSSSKQPATHGLSRPPWLLPRRADAP